jgi:hypothetical protein
MPLDCKEKLNPYRLKRDGVNQSQRLVAALNPDSVKVDEREIAHWMVFASRYAPYLSYFDKNNLLAGDWMAFFTGNPAAYLATAAVQDVEFYKTNLYEFSQFLLDLDNESDAVGLRQNFGNLLNCTGTLAWQLEQLHKALPDDLSLKAGLKNLIISQLRQGLARLVRYYLAAQAQGDADLTNPPTWDVLGTDVSGFDAILAKPFSTDWTDGATPWLAFVAALTPDASIYGQPLPPTVFDRLNHAAAHNLFSSILEQFLKAYSRVVTEAKRSLQAVFENRADHAPHYALFLAFLRLLTNARDHANSLTARHLDFYYREVLQLKTQAAEPNEAHILVELAKHVDAHSLKKDTLLKAGKDSKGTDVFYKLVEDFVANKAKVMELKSVFLYDRKASDLTNGADDGRIYASPVANSADGLGTELTTPDQQWHPFSNKIYKGEQLEGIAMPKAEIGFMVASHYLWLREGARTVILSFRVKPGGLPDAKDIAGAFDLEITGEKGWIKLAPFAFVLDGASAYPDLANSLNIMVNLNGEMPSTVPYSPKIHGGNYGAELPMARVTLRQNDAVYSYESLSVLEVDRVKIITFSQGLKDLAISNDFGDIDPSKPFQPFGAQPVADASLVIGCKELFQKQRISLDSLTVLPSLRIVWKALPARGEIKYLSYNNHNTTPPDASLQFLQNGQWTGQGATASFQLFPTNEGASQELTGFASYVEDEPDFSTKQFYQVNSKNGYFRLRLNSDFGHKTHLAETIEYAVEKDEKPEFAPYSPTIEEISLNYWSEQDIDLSASVNFDQRQAHFYHLHPFGHTEEHAFLNNGTPPKLLPQFLQAPTGNDPELCLPSGAQPPAITGVLAQNEAEFYIGVADLKPPQNLALLFQLAEGSANPKTVKPDDHVRWSYLSQNRWVALKKDQVNDRTGQLLRSGIVTLSMPRDASNDNTLLPAGMHWLRASIAKQNDETGQPIPTTSDAVCKIIKVAAQATRAVFADHANAEDFLQEQLAGGTIAKLLAPQAEVKKVAQPYPTFGGRPAEQPAHFYTRVSERLRHKHRAITNWDYERMVLEAFPHIFKVKCLNHTLFVPTESGFGKYNELAPGHVTFIAIPNLRNHNAIDPLRPYVSLGDLESIEAFLKKHLSCHVKLHVHNPVFEPVRVEFCVKFHPGVDEAFHLKLLKSEIVRFLSPWAFNEGKDISFGGRLHKSSLINFVEEQAYVDYLTDFQLFHQITDTSGKDWQKIDQEEIEASTAISILVSAAAEEHTIKAIPVTETNLAGEHCNC